MDINELVKNSVPNKTVDLNNAIILRTYLTSSVVDRRRVVVDKVLQLLLKRICYLSLLKIELPSDPPFQIEVISSEIQKFSTEIPEINLDQQIRKLEN